MNVKSWRVKHFVFRWELSYFYKRILPISQCFRGWGMSTLLHGTRESAWKKHSTSCKQMWGIEVGASSPLFPCENWVSMWKECLQEKSLLKWRFLHPLKITHFRQMDKASYLSHDTMRESWDALSLLSLSEMRNTAYLSGFYSVETLPLGQLPFKCEWQKHSVLWRQSMLEEGGSTTVFPEGRQLGFERQNAYFSVFPNRSNNTFVPTSSIWTEWNKHYSMCRKKIIHGRIKRA